MTRRAAWCTLAVVAGLVAYAGSAAAQQPPATPVRFVVLGHIRGDISHRINPKLGELLEEVRTLQPDFIVLAGDIIWGDIDHDPSRPAEVEAEWNSVDSALATLHTPIYRVPGNHDVPDLGTRDIWIRRYGRPPSVALVGGVRLILLSSTFFPPDGDIEHHRFINGVDIDSGQIAFLKRTLADTGAAHTFVFTGHNLWWQADAGRWWREVHPLLAAAHVDNVFTGDYGPLKFSTRERDGVRYYQTSMEGASPSLPMLHNRVASRLLSNQFDNYLEVTVADSVQVSVQTIGEVSSGMFTPMQWSAIENAPPPPLSVRLRPLVDTWKKKAGLALLLIGPFVAGVLLGRRRAA